MRCIACDAEMRLVRVVPDDTMLVPGYEYQTHECVGCREVETRLFFSREPIQAPPPDLPMPTNKTQAASSPSTWERAVARLRIQQSALNEQAAVARDFTRLHQFNRVWKDFVPLPPGPTRPQARKPGWKSNQSVKAASQKYRAQNGGAPEPTLGQLVARLRRPAAINVPGAIKMKSDEARQFDLYWENPAAVQIASAATPPRLAPLPKSMSLVPIEGRPGAALSAWARAMLNE